MQCVVQREHYFMWKEGSIHRPMDAAHLHRYWGRNQSINEPTSAPLQTVCPPTKKRTTLSSDAHKGVAHVASFTHSIKTRANGVKFAHQSLWNPKISTLLKAVWRGFLDGCLNLSEKLINKYLNASPATAKGHMKHPQHGIRSTTPKPIKLAEI